ncbi:MAG: hypothetical protein WC520_03600 [Candidatus Paceibacterota bacterium]
MKKILKICIEKCLKVVELGALLTVGLYAAWQFIWPPIHEIGHLIVLKLIVLDAPIGLNVSLFGDQASIEWWPLNAAHYIYRPDWEWAVYAVAGFMVTYLLWLFIMAIYRNKAKIFALFVFMFSLSATMLCYVSKWALFYADSLDWKELVKVYHINPDPALVHLVLILLVVISCIIFIKKMYHETTYFVRWFFENDDPFFIKLGMGWRSTIPSYNKNPH